MILLFLVLLVIAVVCVIKYVGYMNSTYYKVTKKPFLAMRTDVGTYGEYCIFKLLKSYENKGAKFLFNVYLPKGEGETTEIDVLMICSQGIYVFESKNYSGWIFGNEHQKKLTQLLDYGKEKHRFYNPVMQNAGHIQANRQSLPQNPDIPIYSVIVFFGSSEFKNITCHANNTFIIYPHSIQRVVSEILTQPNAVFGNKYEIMDLFTKAVQNGYDPLIVASQINSAAYYGRNTPQSTYYTIFGSLFRRGGFSFRRRFW